QFGELVRHMCGRLLFGSHLPQAHVNASLGSLPRRFRASQPASDYIQPLDRFRHRCVSSDSDSCTVSACLTQHRPDSTIIYQPALPRSACRCKVRISSTPITTRNKLPLADKQNGAAEATPSAGSFGLRL